MIGKNDVDAAARELLERERERLGGPPSPEEVVAYQRGELSEDAAARVRTLLAFYPELAPHEPPPTADDVLSDEEMDEDWAAIRRRLPGAPARRERQWWPIAAAIAAAVFAVLAVQSRLEMRRLERTLETPRVLGVKHTLLPMNARGAEQRPTPIASGEDVLWIAAELSAQRKYASYRVDLIEETTSRTLWSADAPRPGRGAIELAVPRTLLRDGATYRLTVYGIADGRAEAIGDYAFRPE